MKLAFAYAGQGSQKVGMGKDFYEEYEVVRDYIDSISLDFDLKLLMFEGSEEELSKTKYTQPCMAAFAAAVTKLLQGEGIVPGAAMGLSLGEYSALFAAGVFDERTFLDLVAYRGKVMQETTASMDCSMSAIMGLDYELTKKVVEAAAFEGVVSIANLNCSGQIVIGGETKAVRVAETLAKESGAKRCIPLKVSGPFHTALMEEASVLLGDKLKKTSFSEMKLPVLFNVNGGLLPEGCTVQDMLIAQVKSSVYFETIIKNIEVMGIDTVIEIGPGKVLSGFFKKTSPQIKVYSIEDVASYLETVRLLKEACGG